MRVKTSVSLSKEALREIDRYAGKGGSRSRVVEQAIEAFLASRRRAEEDAHDLEIINRHADALNREAADALEFQKKL